MSFWQWLSDNGQKILGAITSVNATFVAIVASGGFNEVMDKRDVIWLGIFGAFVGAIITGIGFNNTTKERVAASMETAILAQPGHKQKGFIRPLMLGLLLALSVPVVGLVGGCTYLGQPTANSFNERLATGYVTVTTIRSTALTLLNTQKITVDDAKNIQEQANNIRAALDIARGAVATSPDLAEDKLTFAITTLSALQIYLQRFQ